MAPFPSGLWEAPSRVGSPYSPCGGAHSAAAASDITDNLSRKERRELENSSCIGGLRNPRFAQERVPGLRDAGRTIYKLLNDFINLQPKGFVDDIHSERAAAMADQLQKDVAEYLCKHLGCSARRGKQGKLRPDLAAALQALSGDPDTEVVRWLDTGAPLGITSAIRPCGVFPSIEPKEVTQEAHDFYATSAAGMIYRSAVEEGAWVQEKLDEMVGADSMDVFPDLEAAKAVYGDIVISKLACLVKEVPGTKDLKKRLLVDMLRSGSNSLVVVLERGVLPRLSDAAGDTRRLAFLCGPGEFIDLLVVDVSDAFFTVGVEKAEQRFQAVVGPDGRIYVFRVLGMGGASAPLVWGRVAAWIGRHTQAIFDGDSLRLQIFVDDPFLAARGTRAIRRRHLAMALLFWLALGLVLSWKKRQMGAAVQWIGGELDITTERLTISIQRRFVEKMLKECLILLDLPAIPVKRMRSFVGGMSWMMCIILWMRAWLSPLWAAVAVSAQWAGPPDKATIGPRQVSHSLTWIAAFLSGQRGSIVRSLPVTPRPAEDLIQIVCDASPWGLGAVLVTNGVAIEMIEDIFTEHDHLVMETTAGSHEGQSAFEALAVLVAVRHWLPSRRDEPATVVLQSDSMAALGAAAKLGSPVPKINVIVRELALEMAEGSFEIDLYGHVPGDLNTWADALSRRQDPNGPKEVPPELAHLPVGSPEPRGEDWWRARGSPSASATSSS